RSVRTGAACKGWERIPGRPRVRAPLARGLGAVERAGLPAGHQGGGRKADLHRVAPCPTSPGVPDDAAPTPILGLRAGAVPAAAFLCGDPARVDRIAAGWGDVRVLCAVREFRVLAGEWQGRPLAAASTGVGAPGTAIVVEEL